MLTAVHVAATRCALSSVGFFVFFFFFLVFTTRYDYPDSNRCSDEIFSVSYTYSSTAHLRRECNHNETSHDDGGDDSDNDVADDEKAERLCRLLK